MLQPTTSKNLSLEWLDNRAIFHYGRAEHRGLTLREAAVYTASVINDDAAQLSRVPTVLLSGGLDSEVVVKAFVEAGKPFRCVTFRYPDDLNAHEIGYVKQFVSELNLDHRYIDIDIERWALSSEAEGLFRSTKAAHFEIVPHMKAVSEVWSSGGYPVLGCMEVVLENTALGWCHVEYSHDASWYLHAANNGYSGAMGFFQHTPELMLAQLTDARMLKLVSGENALANKLLTTSRQVKYQMYRDHWPELRSRPKFDGGERVRELFRQQGNKLEPYRLRRAAVRHVTPHAAMVALLIREPQRAD